MKRLLHQLQIIRDSAKEFSADTPTGEILQWIKEGHPYDTMFYRHLKDEHWLQILEENDIFNSIPEGRAESKDGSIIYQRSPALYGLANLATIAPVAVMNLLETIELYANPAYTDQALKILAQITESDLAERVIRLTNKLLKASNSVSMMEVRTILNNYADLSHITISLLQALLESQLEETPGNSNYIDNWQIREIDEKVIPTIASELPFETAELIFNLLVDWAEAEKKKEVNTSSPVDRIFGKASEPNPSGPSSFWLEDFHRTPSSYREFEGRLTRRLFLIGAKTILHRDNNPAQVTKDFDHRYDTMLRTHPWELFQRLRWQLYADYPENTQDLARKDACELIASDGCPANLNYELAKMLENHCEMYGYDFLSNKYIQTYYDAVLDGPLDHDGNKIEESDYIKRWHYKQLYPIRTLLVDDQRDYFITITPTESQSFTLETYKPYTSNVRSGSINSISPVSCEELAKLKNTELWDFLNTWKPTKPYLDRGDDFEEESTMSLAKEFAKLLSQHPDKFPPETSWWNNIDQPEILSVTLEEILKDLLDENTLEGRYSNLSDDDWVTLFGISERILDQGASNAQELTDNHVTSEELPLDEWNYPRLVVARFLEAAAHPKNQLEDHTLDTIQSLLVKNLAVIDLNIHVKKKNFYDNWQGSAINSIRGTTVEGLIRFAWHGKNNKRALAKYSWVLDTIRELLSTPDESPVVFAILGSKLRLLVYIFGDEIGAIADLLLPKDKPESRNALIISHTLYDQPMKEVLIQLPNLPDHTLNLLEESHALEGKSTDFKDFANRVGLDILFYHWNSIFKDEVIAQELINRFFAVATSTERASTISQIARAFSKTEYNDDNQEILTKVMSLWEDRYSQLIQQVEAGTILSEHADEELNAFIDWLGCDCFPFDWRVKYVELALGQLSSDLQAYTATDNLTKIAKDPTKLQACLSILKQMIDKSSGHNSLWQFETEDVITMVKAGIHSNSTDTISVAEEAQDALLRKELFRFINL